MARGGPDAAGGARRCGGGGGEKEPPDKTISSAQPPACLAALLPIKLSTQHCLAGCNLCLSQVRRRVRRVRVRSCKWLRGPSRALVRRKTHLFFSMPCYTKNDNFTKTGSGQTYTGKHWKKEAFCAGSEVLWLVGGAQHPPEGTFLHKNSTARHSTAQHNASSSCGIAMMTNHHVIIMTSS